MAGFVSISAFTRSLYVPRRRCAVIAYRAVAPMLAVGVLVLGGCVSGSGSTAETLEPSLASADAPAQASPVSDRGVPDPRAPQTRGPGDPRGALVRVEIELLTAGIEPLGNDPATPESLRHHAERLWSAREAQDWSVTYDYRDVLRAVDVTRERFVAWSQENEPFGYDEAEVLDVQIDGKRGWVQLQLTVRLRNIPNVPVREIQRWERWLHEFGRWAPVAPQDFDKHQRAPAERSLDREQRLAERFQQWWNAVYAEDWDMLYEFSDPQLRSMVTLEQFREARAQLSFLDHQIEWLQAVGDQGTVRCAYLIKMTDPSMDKLPPRLTVVSERWVLRDGQWYHSLPTGENE